MEWNHSSIHLILVAMPNPSVHRLSRLACLLLAAVSATTPALGAQDIESSPARSMPPVASPKPQAAAPSPHERSGERLDPLTAFGPVVIETMAEVMERERSQPSSTRRHKARNGSQGSWAVPTMRSSFHAHSGEHYLINKWGDTLMPIEFPGVVDFEGCWIAGHGAPSLWARGVRISGYRSGELVATSEWLEFLEHHAVWLPAGFERVDRIEVEARAAYEGGGWYALDDLTYREPAGAEDAQIVLDFDDLSYGQRVTGSDYAGLTWPTGQGDFDLEYHVVHPPATPPTDPMEESPPLVTNTHVVLGGNATAPELQSSFGGPFIGDPGAGWLPPDTCGAVGIDHFVAVVNQHISVYEKSTGNRVVATGLRNFFNTNDTSAGDPRAVFDPHSNRFFVIAADFETKLWFGMSLSEDPTGPWFKTSINLSQGTDAGRWPDYPTLGVDANGIYSASYMVGGSNRMSIFAIEKAPLLNVLPTLGAVTAFRELPWEGAIQPCVTHGDPGRAYFVSRRSSTSLRLRYVQGPLTSPTLVEAGNPSVPSHSSPPDAPAMGSIAPLDALDWRPMNAVYRNGSVWTAHGVNVGGRAACRWYELDASSATTQQVGTVASASMSYMFPSIAVNGNDEVLLAFSGSNSSTFASSYAAGRLSTDPQNQLSDPVLLQAGLAPYNTVDQDAVNRWGDYSLTCVDPTDDVTLWTIQEHTRNTDDWGTRVGSFRFPFVCLEPQAYCASLPNSASSGAQISYFGSTSLATNDLNLSVSGLPVGTPGLVFFGPNQIATLFGDGVRCVGGGITRLSPVQSDLFGFVNIALDLNSPPFDSGSGAATVGESANFQYWFRDPSFGTAGYNTSDALQVTYCP